MDIEVPRLKDVATDVKPNLQDRLNAVTEILCRVSKLVSDDLDKAVSSTVGQDKDGNQSPEKSHTPSICFVLRLYTVRQVPLRTRGQSWLWFPVQLPQVTLVGRRVSVPVSF